MKRKIRTRNLTVEYARKQRAYGFYKEVPLLRLAGVWLMEAGFTSGDKVTAEVSHNRIVIRNLPSVAQPDSQDPLPTV